METFLYWSISIVSSLVFVGIVSACMLAVHIYHPIRDDYENEDDEE